MKTPKLYILITLAMLLLNGCNVITSPISNPEISLPPTNSIFNTHTTIFDSISAKLTDTGGTLLGKVDIVGAHSTPALYFEIKEDIDIKIDYSLVRYKGNLRVAYISPEKSETTLIDTSSNDNDMIDDTITLSLKKGIGRIEFFGDNTIYDFSFNFKDINPDIVSYFDIIEKNVDESKEMLFASGGG